MDNSLSHNTCSLEIFFLLFKKGILLVLVFFCYVLQSSIFFSVFSARLICLSIMFSKAPQIQQEKPQTPPVAPPTADELSHEEDIKEPEGMPSQTTFRKGRNFYILEKRENSKATLAEIPKFGRNKLCELKSNSN